MAEICVICNKPIEMLEPSIYRKNDNDDIGEVLHYDCSIEDDNKKFLQMQNALREICKYADEHGYKEIYIIAANGLK